MVFAAELVCKRAENQVTGFSRGQRQPNRLEVAKLADQDHVRVFTQGRAQATR